MSRTWWRTAVAPMRAKCDQLDADLRDRGVDRERLYGTMARALVERAMGRAPGPGPERPSDPAGEGDDDAR